MADRSWMHRQPRSSIPMRAMNLTPEEDRLYQYHLHNLTPKRWLKQPDGATTTVYSRTETGEEYGGAPGRWYNFPSYFPEHRTAVSNGILDGDPLWNAVQPMSQWPSYASQAEAEARYNEMHHAMELDMIPSQLLYHRTGETPADE